jgi:fructose-bisphosphate aldolase, class II
MPIDEIVNNCTKARELMKRSREEHFAVGAFNVDNIEILIAICRASQKLRSPVIIELSQGEIDFLGIKNIRSIVNNLKEEFGIKIFINLDHSPSIDAAKKGIDGGFEFIHIDISQANHNASEEEIIQATREVVDYAKKTGALVESEPHYFSGSSNIHNETINYEEIKKTFSTPQSAKDFIEKTGIDTFAVAIGNLHGKYPVPKELDLELLTNIRQNIECNISLHGGSGTPLEYFSKAAQIGVSKININTDLRFTYRTMLEKVLRENPDEYALPKIIEPVILEVQKVIEEKIIAFGSSGKQN